MKTFLGEEMVKQVEELADPKYKPSVAAAPGKRKAAAMDKGDKGGDGGDKDKGDNAEQRKQSLRRKLQV